MRETKEARRYKVNELFYSIQGEGVRTGTANVFVRFSGCNLSCSRETHGFDCDTEFASGRQMTAAEIVKAVANLLPPGVIGFPGVVFTGGEPALQLDLDLATALRERGFAPLCIETNGSRCVDELDLDWITVSPKVAEHAIKQLTADEVKYVRSAGQQLPVSRIKAKHCLISPAFDGEHLAPGALEHCIELVKGNPLWRLSVQRHKAWRRL